MSYVALGLGVGSLVVGAGTSIYGASQQPDEIGAHQLQAQFFDPQSDPLLAMLSMNAMTGIGGFDPNIYMQASPTQQILANLGASGQVDRRRFKLYQEAFGAITADPERLAALQRWKAMQTGDIPANKEEMAAFRDQWGFEAKDARELDRLETLAINEGYGSLDELIQAEQTYRARGDEIRAQFEPVAEQVRQGILASQGRVGQYLQDLPNILTGAANPFTEQLREQALAQSQKYGVNPYGFLEQADATALQRALSLIGAEQGVLGAQQSGAQGIAALRQQGGVSAGQIGAAQAQALAQQLNANAALQANRANSWASAGQGIGALGLIGYDMFSNPQGPAAQNQFYYGGGSGGGWDNG